MKRAVLIALVAGATVAAIGTMLPRLAVLAARASFLPPDDPTVVTVREVTDEFGFANPLLWILEARDGDLWTTARLRRLAAFTDDVLRIPGVVTLDVIGLASPNMRDMRITDEGFEPTYLMGDVPETPADVTALRRRIDTDPSYAGTLMTRDGRAAMVVANVGADADARDVGRAAIALRDHYRDADTTAWATGAPVLAVTAPAACAAILPHAALYALGALVLFAAALGLRAAGAALLGAALAVAWMATGVALGGFSLPWTLEAALPAALVAAAVGAGAERPLAVAVILAAGALGGAVAAGPRAHQLWLATAAAAPVGVAAGWLARRPSPPMPRRLVGAGIARALAAALALGAAFGATRLGLSLGLFGYGERYLPPAAAEDVAAVRRLFPPPTSFAFRVRGEPGFVTNPDVLRAIDGGASVARDDAAVRSAMSIADVVKLVNYAFNAGRPQYLAIPDDSVIAGRYLALAYSPGLRRFLDRSFAHTALWVLVDDDRPADLVRVLSRVEAALAARPIPGGTVDPPAGDGALVLLMASIAWRIAGGAVVALLLVAGGVGLVCDRRAGARALATAFTSVGAAAGIIGWTWHAADLVSLPLIAVTAVATATIAGVARPTPRFALGLAGAGVVAMAAALPAAPLVAALLLGPALALLACGPAEPPERQGPPRQEREALPTHR